MGLSLAAKGNTQQEGIDCLDTFSPYGKVDRYQILLLLAVIKKLDLETVCDKCISS